MVMEASMGQTVKARGPITKKASQKIITKIQKTVHQKTNYGFIFIPKFENGRDNKTTR